jgi:hypothetical protein
MKNPFRSRRSRTRCLPWLGLYVAPFALAAFSRTAWADPPSWLDRGIVRAAIRRAVERAGLSDDPTRDLITRSRAAGLMPHLSVRVLRGFGSSATQTAQPIERSTYDDSWGMDVRVSFALDRLVFDGIEVTAARMRLERFERRVALERDVIEALAALQRASLSLAGSPEGHPDHPRVAVEVERARAALEVLVGVSPTLLVGR